MFKIEEIQYILNDSPSVNILKLRYRDLIIAFLKFAFQNDNRDIPSEDLILKLSDFLEFYQLESDEESEVDVFDSYDSKAKKYIKKWTDSGFLTNYRDENGTIIYQLSAHTNKTLDWLDSLKKKEFVGAESKFKDLFNQLKQLVEYTNEDVDKRIELLEDKKLTIEREIQDLKMGLNVKVYEDHEIIPRFDQLNRTAKELLSDFKEVEDNFKTITKEIYLKHTDSSLSKSDILNFTFDALEMLKNSHQGRSFYAFWQFLMDKSLQTEWSDLTNELYDRLAEKGINKEDDFLKGMKNYLFDSGQKVYSANDKMATKLSRIIRESDALEKEVTKGIILDIKKFLAEISKEKKRPQISIEIDTSVSIKIPFEKKLTYDRKEEKIYTLKPKLAENNFSESLQLSKVLKQQHIDKIKLKANITNALSLNSQTTLFKIIEDTGGIEQGLPELFGYFGVLKDFTYSFNQDKEDDVYFDPINNKTIQIPEIIITK